MKVKTAPFDAADYLVNDEVIAEYLTAALEDPNPAMFLVAIKDVARARGMTEVAREAGVTRASLYKSLSDDGHPKFETIVRVCTALGVKLVIEPMHA